MRCFKNASKRIFSMCMLVVLISIPNYTYSGIGIHNWQSFGLGTLFALAGLVTADYASTFAGHMSVYLKEKDRLDKRFRS